MSSAPIQPLPIVGAWVVTPTIFGDDRGAFLESFRGDVLATHAGRSFDVVQTNVSVSAAGVLRGLHYADIPPSQAKYVTCVQGAVLDVVVDIRVGSPTFGRHAAVVLDDVDRKAVFVAEGLGHAFMSLEDGSVVTYLCSATYAPQREHGIDPLDPALGIDWPDTDRTGRPLAVRLSEKDAQAPSLRDAEAAGRLPAYADAMAFYAGSVPSPG